MLNRIRVIFVVIIMASISYPLNSRADEEENQESISDGTHDATVTTPSGTYSVQVEVNDGSVDCVQWPNGGCMSVDGAEIENNEATGTNSRGDTILIEIEAD